MEEGVSSGQQELCLFASAPLDFKSVPAELTASSRFAWGDWWIFFHWANSLFLLLFFFLFIVTISAFVCLNHPLYCSAVLPPPPPLPPRRIDFMAEPAASSQLLSEALSFDTRQLAAAAAEAELQNPPPGEERTATDRTELISSMSCSALASLKLVWNPSQGVCPGSTESLAGLPRLPCLLHSAPAEVLSTGQCCNGWSPRCSVQQTQEPEGVSPVRFSLVSWE